jgi:hypothetical protein
MPLASIIPIEGQYSHECSVWSIAGAFGVIALQAQPGHRSHFVVEEDAAISWSPGTGPTRQRSQRLELDSTLTLLAMVTDAAAVERFKRYVDGGDATVAGAVALLALYHYPGLSVDDTIDALDRLAKSVPTPTLESLVATLFRPSGFAGNTTDYYDADNSFLHRVLERRLGIPISLAFIAVEVGRRIGVPLHGVGYPGHFLLRDAADPDTFIDPFGGRILTEGECVMWFHQSHPAGAVWQRGYLAPVDHVMMLTRMISNLVAVMEQKRDFAGLQWLMRLRCALPNATVADTEAFARMMAPLN